VFIYYRRNPILSLAIGIGKNSIGIDRKQYNVCSCFLLVLVHYASGISIASILVANRSLFVSSGCHCLGVCSEFGGIFLWLWMECFSYHGTFIFRLTSHKHLFTTFIMALFYLISVYNIKMNEPWGATLEATGA
jgi:hypothetical protein